MKDALGHGSNAHNSGIDNLPKPKMSAEEFKALVTDAKVRSDQTDKVTAAIIAARTGKFEHPSGRVLFISPSLDPGGGLRATSFDEHGEPLGHREYPGHDNLGLRSEISTALSGGYKLKGGK